jgi:uncharacterized protein YceK
MPKKSKTYKTHKGSSTKGSSAKAHGNAGGHQAKVQGKKLPSGSIGNIGDITKKGCLPKLSILVLPFIAILVYVLLSA